MANPSDVKAMVESSAPEGFDSEAVTQVADVISDFVTGADSEPPTIPMTSADPTARVKMPVLVAVMGSRALVLRTLGDQAEALVEKYAEDPRVGVVVESIEAVAAMVEHYRVGEREAVEVRFTLDLDKGQSMTAISTRDANLHPSFDSLEEYEAFERLQRKEQNLDLPLAE